jgi:hypothetical protein
MSDQDLTADLIHDLPVDRDASTEIEFEDQGRILLYLLYYLSNIVGSPHLSRA